MNIICQYDLSFISVFRSEKLKLMWISSDFIFIRCKSIVKRNQPTVDIKHKIPQKFSNDVDFLLESLLPCDYWSNVGISYSSNPVIPSGHNFKQSSADNLSSYQWSVLEINPKIVLFRYYWSIYHHQLKRLFSRVWTAAFQQHKVDNQPLATRPFWDILFSHSDAFISRKSRFVTIRQQLSIPGNVGASIWWWDASPHTNQLGLGKRRWILEVSSAVVEFPPPYLLVN